MRNLLSFILILTLGIILFSGTGVGCCADKPLGELSQPILMQEQLREYTLKSHTLHDKDPGIPRIYFEIWSFKTDKDVGCITIRIKEYEEKEDAMDAGTYWGERREKSSIDKEFFIRDLVKGSEIKAGYVYL